MPLAADFVRDVLGSFDVVWAPGSITMTCRRCGAELRTADKVTLSYLQARAAAHRTGCTSPAPRADEWIP